MLLFLSIVSPYVPLPSFDKAEPRKDADAGNLANVNKLLERAPYDDGGNRIPSARTHLVNPLSLTFLFIFNKFSRGRMDFISRNAQTPRTVWFLVAGKKAAR